MVVALDQENLPALPRCPNGSVFYSQWGRNRIHGFLESRPDWCISRQRSGGSIPVFFDEDGNALLDSKLIHFLADKILDRAATFGFRRVLKNCWMDLKCQKNGKIEN